MPCPYKIRFRRDETCLVLFGNIRELTLVLDPVNVFKFFGRGKARLAPTGTPVLI